VQRRSFDAAAALATHVTREVTTAAQDDAVADDHDVGGRPVRHFKGHRERPM